MRRKVISDIFAPSAPEREYEALQGLRNTTQGYWIWLNHASWERCELTGPLESWGETATILYDTAQELTCRVGPMQSIITCLSRRQTRSKKYMGVSMRFTRYPPDGPENWRSTRQTFALQTCTNEYWLAANEVVTYREILTCIHWSWNHTLQIPCRWLASMSSVWWVVTGSGLSRSYSSTGTKRKERDGKEKEGTGKEEASYHDVSPTSNGPHLDLAQFQWC